MKKIVFDNSIHLGQFCISNEAIRVASKNSQAMLSSKGENEIVGIESFNENTYSDDSIWGLGRTIQDMFYPFMDVYHSVKNIIRTPLRVDDTEMALKISKEFGVHISNALTCSIAIRERANEIHSFYLEFKDDELGKFMKSFGVLICVPGHTTELEFTDGLEDLYKSALKKFRDEEVDLPVWFHK